MFILLDDKPHQLCPNGARDVTQNYVAQSKSTFGLYSHNVSNLDVQFDRLASD